VNARLPSLVFLAGWFLVSTGCGRTASDSDRDTPKANGDHPDSKPESSKKATLPTAMQIVDWLPPDTETLFVVNGPFQMQAEGEEMRRAANLARLLERLSCSPLGVRKGALIKELAGQEVALAVEGARHFRHASGLGMSRYEGCQVIVFQRDLGAAGDSLKKALASASKTTQEIAGHEVFSLEEKFEKDVWTFFFTQPLPNVLVCATDQGFLGEVLARMDRPEGKRALPKDLPEWKHVDTTARFWAIRHFDLDSPLAIDPEGVGLVFTFNPGEGPEEKVSATVKYLTDENDLGKIAKAWTYVGEAKLTPKVKQLAPGVVEITAHLRDERDAGRFFFVLLFHLGHGIAV
jgi:hypothetical protein